MESDATADAPERALTEALLSLSWPLPRTVGDADAALTRLEEVRGVLARLEQESVGTGAWWSGPVDALATQSGFVLEWWRPVLRDPDLDWTLNHQAHLTADLATLASAGARLLDQIEPRPGQEAQEAAAHARRAARDRRWGPAAVPPFAPRPGGAGTPGARPRPPAAVFGGDAPPSAKDLEPPFPPPPQSPATAAPAGEPGRASTDAAGGTAAGAPAEAAAEAAAAGSARHRRPSYEFDDAGEWRPDAVPGLDGPPDSGDTSVPEAASWPEPAPWPEVAPWPGAVPAHEAPPDGGMGGGTQERPGGAGGSPLDDPAAPPAMPLASAVLPASSAVVPPAIPPVMPLGAPPQPASVPGPVSVPVRGPGGVAGPGPGPDAVPSGSAFTPPPGPAARGSARTTPHAGDSGNYGDYGDYERYERYDDEDDEPARLVPTALRRHQRRLLLQTVAILAAIGVLCWWAVTTVSGKSGHPAAAGSTRVSTGQAGLGAPGATTGEPAGSAAPSSAAANQGSATAVAPPPPSAGRPSVPDATTVSSIQVTLLGGSGSVPQIVALISVHTAGTGAVNVTGSYYGASGGSGRVAPEQQSWTFTGKTGYEYSVPISNSAYCGTAFTFTVTAGGRSATQTTAPGC